MTRSMVVGAALLAAAVFATGCSRPAASAGAAARPSAPSIDDGVSLVRAMQQRYGGQWFRTLSFTQNNTLYSPRGGETTSQWLERISVPGKVRIDYLPLSQRSGVLFDGSRVHTFDNGRALDTRPGVNVMLLVTGDIYVLPVEQSLRMLDSLGFDTKTLRRDTWNGRPAYVVGAAAGDSTASQFWVDSARMVAFRIVQKERRGARDVVTDVRFDNFVDVGGYPVATQVQQLRDGRLVFKEQHVDVRVNEPIPEAVFDPTKWGTK